MKDYPNMAPRMDSNKVIIAAEKHQLEKMKSKKSISSQIESMDVH
jgi:hypothetical protein